MANSADPDETLWAVIWSTMFAKVYILVGRGLRINNRNKFLAAKLLQHCYRYHKLRKRFIFLFFFLFIYFLFIYLFIYFIYLFFFFLKFYLQRSEIISKYNMGLSRWVFFATKRSKAVALWQFFFFRHWFYMWRLCSHNFIMKTCLYNFDPLKPHFYIVKLGFTGVYIIFLIFC